MKHFEILQHLVICKQTVGVENKIIFIKKMKRYSDTIRILHSPSVVDTKRMENTEGEKNYIIELPKFEITREQTMPLGDICFVTYGLRPSSDKDDPKQKFRKSDLLSEQKSLVHNKLYTEGKFIERYVIAKEIFIEWGTERSPDRLVRSTFPELYDPDKLLMSRQKRVVAFSNKKHICDTTIVVGVLFNDLRGIENSNIRKYFVNIKKERKDLEDISARFDLKYLLVILNSNLIQYHLKFNSAGNIDSTPDDWKQIPIKNIPKHLQFPFIEKANILLNLHNEFYSKQNRFTDKIKDKFNVKISKRLERFYHMSSQEFINELKKISKFNLSLKEEDEWQAYFEDYKTELLHLEEKISTEERISNTMIYDLYDVSKVERELIELTVSNL